MPDFKITSPDGLIETTIKAKQETYYLVTQDNLNSLKQKSLLSDLFMLLASLAWGAYFSVVITVKALPTDPAPNSPVKNILQALETLDVVFLIAGFIFSILAVLMIYLSFNQVTEMKKSKLEINEKTAQIPKAQTGETTVLILSATYEWPNGQKNVTDAVKNIVKEGKRKIYVHFETFGIDDPAKGVKKHLDVHFKINGEERSLTADDFQYLYIE